MGVRGMTAAEVVDTGLLHVINEAELWPKGYALNLMVEASCIPAGQRGICDHEPSHMAWDRPAWLVIDREGDLIVTGLSKAEHAKRHEAFIRAFGLQSPAEEFPF